jgi:hypothetical protein
MRGLHKSGLRIGIVGLAVAAAVGWACGSSDNSDSGGTSSGAGGMFKDQVYPSLSSTCQECHATGKSGAPVFLGATAEISYTAIEGFPGLLAPPSISPLIQKGPHSGPALTDTQNTIVTNWLKAEVTERKLGNDPGVPKNLRAAFKAFGDCMSFARWTELKLNQIALTTTDGNQGECRSCHGRGEASNWLDSNNINANDPADQQLLAGRNDPKAGETFLRMRRFPYVQRLVVGRVNDQGEFDGIEPARRLADKGNEAQQPQSNSHPRYALSTELANNLNQYVLETISNVAANRCSGGDTPDAGLVDAADLYNPP